MNNAPIYYREFWEEARKLADRGLELGLTSVLIAARDDLHGLAAREQVKDETAQPVCYRFNELASSRTILVDSFLSLQEAIREVADMARRNAPAPNPKKIDILDYPPK